MFSDTHLRLEFHQSIHCTCHCFSQTPIYDWSFTSQFTVPVIVSLRHLSTTGVSPVNSLYLSLFLSDAHLRLEFHQSIHCTCHCFSQTPIYDWSFTSQFTVPVIVSLRHPSTTGVSPVNSLYLSLFLSDTHLRLEFHQSIHCTCHCFSQTPIYDWSFTSQFTVPVIVSLRHPSTTGVSPVNSLYLSLFLSDTHLRLEFHQSIHCTCHCFSQTPIYDWSFTSQFTVPVIVSLRHPSTTGVSPVNSLYLSLFLSDTHLRLEFHQSIHCTCHCFSQTPIYDWSFTSQFTVPVIVSLRHPSTTGVSPVNSLYLSLFLSDTHLRLEFHQSIHCPCHCFSQTPIYDWSFTSQFTVPVIVSLRHPSTTGVSPVNSLYLSLFLSDIHLRLEFHQSIHCTCHCFSQTPIYDWSFTSQFTVPVIVSLRHPSTTGVSPVNSLYLSLFLSDTHLRLEFHQSIHCTCHCFSQTSIYDWSFTSQFTVPVIVSLRRPSTTGVSPVNSLYLSLFLSDTHLQLEFHQSIHCTCHCFSQTPIYDWSFTSQFTVPVIVSLRHPSTTGVSPVNSLYLSLFLSDTHLRLEFHQSIHCTCHCFSQTPIYDWSFTSQFTVPVIVSLRHPSTTGVSPVNSLYLSLFLSDTHLRLEFHQSIHCTCHCF